MTVRLNALHAQHARERVKSNGELHEILQAEPLPHKPSLLERLFKPEILTVAGRAVKGFVIPHWAAGVMLAAILGGMGFMYSRMSDQRDMLIRLDAVLAERDRHDLEYRSEFKTQINLQKAYIDNMTNQLNTVKGMLTPQQVRYVERNTRKTEN